jgi:hypothetical protein
VLSSSESAGNKTSGSIIEASENAQTHEPAVISNNSSNSFRLYIQAFFLGTSLKVDKKSREVAISHGGA